MIYLPKTKKCRKCSQIKRQDEFHFNSGSKDGLGSWCRHCAKGKGRQIQLQQRYNLTVKQYELILESQNNVCTICGKLEIIKCGVRVKRLAVDHNHTTGKVRGLLCSTCNLLVAHVENNPKILKEIPRYLRRGR